MAGLDWASRMRVVNFNDLIRGARACGFLDDVEHWESEKARFIAERTSAVQNQQNGRRTDEHHE